MTTRKRATKSKSNHLLFEHRNLPLLPREEFYKRQILFLTAASMLIILCLLIGMAGYHWIAELDWTESFHNAAMILAGMGEIDEMPDHASKIFSGSYALFSGVVFLSTVAVMFSPLVHRFLHKMHLEKSTDKEKQL